ncbi:nitrite/sulfite reductase [Stygiolobus caldivivus]|uniref:Nitrite/sulfite reductase n=1 Tax=Stygiolobus caldivivus TaxID=2824673 RepID=A0A8D5U899_9CREN|nr:nitrite/sulfite reductase [Stygiolobus caldivivus]BCU71620.1 hypothetical protein KN1_29170 [Stygiolobus caldivivus]
MSISFKDKYKLFYPRRYEGIYTSRGDNPLISIRIRQGKGRDPSQWTAEQFEKLVEITRDYGNNKIHLTSRGDVELYGIDMKHLDEILAKLESVGLSPRDSCGASVRNVIPCLSQICPKANVDAEKVAIYISNFFRYNKEYEYPNLPKRVKISISACEVGCAHPVIMDVGIVGKNNGKFDVMVGGGIGEKAFEAKTLFTDVTLDKLLPICVAVANILKRENEKRGFKHIVEKYGEDKIKEMIIKEANDIAPTLPPLKENITVNKFMSVERLLRVKPIGGWLDIQDIPEIVSVMRRNLGYGYLFNTQELYIPITANDYSVKLRAPNEITDTNIWKRSFNVNSCIGNDYCPPALVPTTEMASKVYERLKDEGINIRISFSGCTHSCGKHWVMDLGFGAIANRGDVRLNVVVGGGNKKIGKVIGSIPADKYMEVTDKLVKLVKEGKINLENIDENVLREHLKDVEGFEEIKKI